jgi:hypothetical protein
MNTEAELTAALEAELGRMPSVTLCVSAAELLQMVTLLQLAIRHPGIEASQGSALAAQFARRFIASIRDGLSEFPAVQQVIALNGAVGNDRPC